MLLFRETGKGDDTALNQIEGLDLQRKVECGMFSWYLIELGSDSWWSLSIWEIS